MVTNVAINGFGRIGRMILRAFHERNVFELEKLLDISGDINIVAVNDLAPFDTNLHLLKYDTVHGGFISDVFVVEKNQENDIVKGTLDIGYGKISFLQESDPEKINWSDFDVDVVLECSGKFTSHKDASKHLKSGAKFVLISAPSQDADLTVVYGVNHLSIKDQKIISNASCTTNCLAPVAKVLNDTIGIKNGHMTTIHSYTGDQRIVDMAHKDLRRARASGLSMIPTTTGAAKAVGLVLPELAGKLDGIAIRVPTPNVSGVDFTFVSSKKTTVEEINSILEGSSNDDMYGIIGYTDEPLVSIDFNHCADSATIDSLQTSVIGGNFCRVFAWYDNEWGFSNRMIDVVMHIHNITKGSFFDNF